MMDVNRPTQAKWLPRVVYTLIVVGLVGVLLILPREAAQWVFIGAILVSWRVVGTDHHLHRALRLPNVPPLPTWLRYSLEIVVVLVIIGYFSRHLWDWSPESGVLGQEISYLANSGLTAGAVFQRSGTIPLWNPLMANGEPLIEGPFSFVLNPLMLAPFLWLPALQAVKFSVLAHLLLAGVGGWMLGYTLKYRVAGRLLLACLLCGNGSMNGAIGGGLFQMGLSQAYVIWVYAGLFGTLYRYSRAYVGVLVISAMLLISAGTFWYALPTALACMVIIPFALVQRDEHGKWRVNGMIFRRIGLASLLILGLSAARWLPTIINSAYIDHPRESFTYVLNIPDMVKGYFSADFTDWHQVSIEYHYIVPALFAGVTVLLLLSLWRGFDRLPALTVPRLRLIVPSVLLILLFTIWAYADIPLIRALYARIDLLSHWRILGRMMAAATPFIAVLCVLAFEDALSLLAKHSTTNFWRGLAMIALVIFAAFSAADVLRNIQRTTRIVPVQAESTNRVPIYTLRQATPSGMLVVNTLSFHDYFAFYETLTRAYNGNPDIRIRSMPATLGNRYSMQLPPRYVLVYDERNRSIQQSWGYQPVSLTDSGADTGLWENPDAPDYTFIIPIHRSADLSRVGREATTAVLEFSHHFDRIRIVAPNSRDDTVLVAQETAYPGWTVMVDGQPAQLEVVGSFIGVRLPNKDENAPPTIVEFRYRPRWLTISALITLFSAGVLAAFLLRVERLISRDDA
ncbi:MAG: hypothetical protein RLP44_19620 [Aggregatilineales bacterium]